MPHLSRFKKRVSDRSGFDRFESELVKQGPWKGGAEEFDRPPPSKLNLGGEGDASGEPRVNATASTWVASSLGVPVSVDNPTVYITAAGGISPSFVHPWMRLSGSNGAVTITATPQLVRGQEGQVLTLQVVDSSVTISHGSANAVNFMDSRGTLQLTSGMVLTLYYSTANLAWNETARYRP